MVRLHVSASAVLSARKQKAVSPRQGQNPILSLPASQQDDNFHLERILHQQACSAVAGVDEVGRGPLAGPVLAAAVILPEQCAHSLFLDSKKLSLKKLKELFSQIHEIGAFIGVGTVSHEKIDKINILQASLMAMKRAVDDLGAQDHLPDFLLVDGKFPIPHPLQQQTLIKGESRSASIAAASIIAKVTRDRLMAELHEQYPVYNFIKNQGYPTKEHRNAIKEHGICPFHRHSFKGVKEFV